jgi:hypothetical protein
MSVRVIAVTASIAPAWLPRTMAASARSRSPRAVRVASASDVPIIARTRGSAICSQ